MTILYNCKHSGDQYRITKFDDGEPTSSYLTTLTECDCPAGVRPNCRHREMLPYFIAREAVNSTWWYDYDRGGWVQMEDETEPHSTTVSAPDFESEDIGSNPVGVATTQHSSVAEQSAHNGSGEGSIPSAATKPYRKPNDGRRV